MTSQWMFLKNYPLQKIFLIESMSSLEVFFYEYIASYLIMFPYRS